MSGDSLSPATQPMVINKKQYQYTFLSCETICFSSLPVTGAFLTKKPSNGKEKTYEDEGKTRTNTRRIVISSASVEFRAQMAKL